MLFYLSKIYSNKFQHFFFENSRWIFPESVNTNTKKNNLVYKNNWKNGFHMFSLAGRPGRVNKHLIYRASLECSFRASIISPSVYHVIPIQAWIYSKSSWIRAEGSLRRWEGRVGMVWGSVLALISNYICRTNHPRDLIQFLSISLVRNTLPGSTCILYARSEVLSLALSKSSGRI